MSTLHFSPSNQRFAWLTPLQSQKTSSGPWMLCENRTHHLKNSEKATVSVTIDALLRLLAASFVDKGDDYGGKLPTPSHYHSSCERFEIRQQQLDHNDAQLFVQQKTDYFQRLELYIDNALVAAYHEPVWPHLQHPRALSCSNLNLPVDCMEFLEHRASQSTGLQSSMISSNQASHQLDDKNAAA